MYHGDRALFGKGTKSAPYPTEEEPGGGRANAFCPFHASEEFFRLTGQLAERRRRREFNRKILRGKRRRRRRRRRRSRRRGRGRRRIPASSAAI